jgi:cytochrome c oxidase subunit IV
MVVRYSAIQFTLCVLAYLTTFIASPALRWVLGCAMIIASVGVSVAILHKKTSLWNTLVRKVLKRD